MSDDFKNKISRIEIENFTCFEKAEIDFSSGINVIIGENGTGKTHLLKLLYNAYLANKHLSDRNFYIINNPFGVVSFDDLLRNQSLKAKVVVSTDKSPIILDINPDRSDLNIVSGWKNKNNDKNLFNSIYLPPQEMLSWQRGFSSIYDKYDLDFDSTYNDLAMALNIPLFKNSYLEEAQKLVTELKKAIKGTVIKKDRKFYIQFDEGGEHQSSIVATGINKIAQVIYLILNGSITKDSILFWDEPEASLNPRFIKIVSKFLQVLAKAGLQVFVATHDYLLIHQLSLEAEYRTEDTVPMRFFSLYKDAEKDGTQVESGDTMAQIQNDSILDEFSEHYKMEERKFSKSLNQK